MRGAIHPLSSLTLSDCFAPPKTQRRNEIYRQGCTVELPPLLPPGPGPGPGPGGDTSLLKVTNAGATASGGDAPRSPHRDSLGTTTKRVAFASVVWVLRALEEPKVQMAVGAAGLAGWVLPTLLRWHRRKV
mgnify:CR=1 FL=1